MTDPTIRAPIPGDQPSASPPPASVTDTPPPALAPPPAAAPPPAPRSAATRDDSSRIGVILVGLLLVGIGAWFFADQTLGLVLPDIDWGRFWPVILIVIGAWIIFGSRRRGPG